jgi:hypothetical protein
MTFGRNGSLVVRPHGLGRVHRGGDMDQDQLQRTRPPGWGLPLGAGIGAGVGMVIGILIGHLTGGLVGGAALGVVAGALVTAHEAVPGDQRRHVVLAALGIILIGLAVMLFLLLRF